MRIRFRLWLLAAALSLPLPVLAQNFRLDWHTVDGGGAQRLEANGLRLDGTIAQPDAGRMAGGAFSLDGGFWALSQLGCACVADMNRDGVQDGRDVQGFISCLMGSGGNCLCADTAQDGTLTASDVTGFVEALLDGPTCD